jgi:predicted lysophospholipase L1 biosynthesis ABC-type transport system permease subunit
LGHSILIGHGLGPEFEERPRLIVGIVGDVRERGLDRDLAPVYYVPEAQAPDGLVALCNRVVAASWVLRTRGNPAALAGSVQREMLRVDPQLPVAQVCSMARIVAKSTARQNFNMLLLGIFAGVALLLATVGIYGVMAYTVEQRTAEIGIRVALGARQVQMLGLILKHGLLLAGMGVAIGLGAAYGLTRLLAGLLFGVTASDPATFVIVSVILTAVALLACFIPASRAARVDPIVALRCE